MVKSAAGSTPLAYSSPKAVQTTGTVADNPGRIAILDVGRMNHDTHQQAGSVGHDMALTAFDFLGRIITSWSAAFGGLDRLAVDDASRGTGFAASGLARLQQQFKIDPLRS